MNYGTLPNELELTSPVTEGGEKVKQTETTVKVHRICITLTSRHVKNVEKGATLLFLSDSEV